MTVRTNRDHLVQVAVVGEIAPPLPSCAESSAGSTGGPQVTASACTRTPAMTASCKGRRRQDSLLESPL